jgi:hypothetical protein
MRLKIDEQATPPGTGHHGSAGPRTPAPEPPTNNPPDTGAPPPPPPARPGPKKPAAALFEQLILALAQERR